MIDLDIPFATFKDIFAQLQVRHWYVKIELQIKSPSEQAWGL